MPLSLSPPFEQLWKDKDPFQEAFALKGRVYREIESRRTLRFELNNQGYFVKLHYGLGWWPIIREWLKGRSPSTGAQAEYTALALLAKIGVHSMQPMAFGSKGANPATQQSFLITKELGNTTNLEEFCKEWPSKPPCPRLKRALITEVATIVRKMHAAGMNHRDCYLVHFLLHNDSLPTEAESDRPQSPQSPRVSLIDLHRAQVRAQVPQRWRNKDLAALAYSSANIGLSFKNQCRFLKTYFQKPLHEIFKQEKPLLAFLQSETIRLTNRWNEKFSQSALEQLARRQGVWMNPHFAAPLAERGVTAANAFDHFWSLQLETTDPPNTGRGGLSEVFQTQIAGVAAYLKRQTMHLRYSLQAPFGEPTFAHEFRSLQRAQRLGISTPKVILFGQKNLPGRPKSAILITESLASTHQSLSNILANWQGVAQPQRLKIMAAIGATIARLHAENLSHNCLYPKHIFIARTPANTVDVALIDFEKTRPAWRAVSKKQDLDRLYRHLPKYGTQADGVSAEEWQALLQAYRTKPESQVFALSNNCTLKLEQVHRVLPHKRITAKAFMEDEPSPVLAKAFLGGGARAKAQAEVSGLNLLKAAGIPCPKVLGQHHLSPERAVVLTEYLTESETLADRLGKGLNIMAKTDAKPTTDQVLVWLHHAIRTLGRLHRAGLIHTDLHFANLLFFRDTLYVLDGDAIQKTESAAQTLTNVAEFFAQLPPRLDQLQGQLLREYAEENPGVDVFKNIAAQGKLNAEIQEIKNWRCEDVLSKAVRDCSLFSVSKTFTKFTACAREDSNWLEPLLKEPDAFMQAGIIKRGNTCTVARTNVNNHKLVIKRYNIKSFGHWLTRFWRPSRAWHSWLSAHRLRFWEIPTPQPIALIEERIGPFRNRAWFVSEEVNGPSMAAHIAQFDAGGVPDLEKQTIHKLFKELHDHRISHGDMKATNFVWAHGHWYLIDLDSVTAHGNESQFRKAWQIDQNRFKANWDSKQWL